LHIICTNICYNLLSSIIINCVTCIFQLKNNDPHIKSVDIFFYQEDGEDYFDATSFNWEEDGRAISENTHLKKLYTNYWPHDDETNTLWHSLYIANAQAFCNALSNNRSIKHYEMERCPLPEVSETFTILKPFFKHNTNLQSFTLSNVNLQLQLNLQTLVTALAECQSLRRISLHCEVNDDDSAEYVVSSLGVHQNLRELSLSLGFHNDNSNSKLPGKKWVIALGNILQNCLSKLRVLSLHNNIGDEGASGLGEALSKNRKLKKLYICGTDITSIVGWSALFRGISNSVSLEEIVFSYAKFGNEGALSFAAEYAIARNSSLKSLDMYGARNITSVGWGTLFRALLTTPSSLEKLDLHSCSIDDIGITALGGALANNSKLKILDIGHNGSITAVGWATFFQRMTTTTNSSLELEDINLQYNNIDDEALVALTTALSTNLNLKILNLRHNQLITSEGWLSFFGTLQTHNHSLVLENLNLSDNTNINDEVVIGFANALINNKSLKTLHTNSFNITARGWAAISTLLCDKASLESIYNSNHTLQMVRRGHGQGIPNNLALYLSMNDNYNKQEVARQKILQYHFADGEENIEEFVDMELEVIPTAIAWMGRDRTGHSLLYRVVRSCLPTLFDSNAKKAAARSLDVEQE